MNTDQILDLFSLKESDTSSTKANGGQDITVDAEGHPIQKGGKNILEDLSELWDESQYEEEYDMGDYLSTLKGAGSGAK